jgi:20S proteasome alpha/beta subunit
MISSKPYLVVPRILKPKPKWLPKRKFMTIAAGFVCRDGIVLCADSQESAGDYKWPVKKLVIPKNMMGKTRIMIAGAGFGPAIDTATQKILNRVSMHQLNYEEILRNIEEVLREIHERDLAFYPTRNQEDVQFQLLIAFTASEGYGGLFSTSGSLVKRVENFEVIGSGMVTNFFAHSLYRKNSWDSPLLSLSEGKVLAAYLIHLAKLQLSSIGGRSQIAAIDDGGGIQVADWDVPNWERFFSEFQWLSGNVMLDCADPSSSVEDFNSRLDVFVAAMKAMKEGFIRNRAEWQRIWRPVQETINHRGVKTEKVNAE